MINEKMKYFKPCRITECFKDENEIIEIVSGNGIIHLKGAGRILWNMSTGEYSIDEIVNGIAEQTNHKDKGDTFKKCISLLIQLNKRELIILNWDSLYKWRYSQYER